MPHRIMADKITIADIDFAKVTLAAAPKRWRNPASSTCYLIFLVPSIADIDFAKRLLRLSGRTKRLLRLPHQPHMHVSRNMPAVPHPAPAICDPRRRQP